MFDFNDRVVLITGASGAIGRDIAKAFVTLGASIALSGTRAGALSELSKSLVGNVQFFQAELRERSSVVELVKKVEASFGKIDVLVNNAGIARDALCLRMKDEDWDDVLEVNLTSAFRLSRVCLRGMLKRKFGRIVNITSVVAVAGNAGQVNYAASKAGMIGMSKALAREVASKGVTVNCVAPGFIDTDMTRDLIASHGGESMLSNIPIGRIGTPSDVTSAVVYLASNESSYVTGQTVHVNGGMLMV